MSATNAPATSIGEVLFIDGAKRPVYVDPDGRQFVLDGAGDRVYGVWNLVVGQDCVDSPGRIARAVTHLGSHDEEDDSDSVG